MDASIKTCKKTISQQNELMTERQIRNIVGDGWAIVENSEWNGSVFIRGKLLYHSSDREEALHELFKRKEEDLFFLYCGKPDPNVVYLL